MKKISLWSILILISLVFRPQWTEAQNETQRERETHVTAAEALNVGYTFMHTDTSTRGGGTQSNEMRKQTMRLIYTGKAVDSATRAVTDCYYVFALQPKGFVIVAADNRVEPILGYSYDNNFVVENMPDHVRGWLGGYERQIQTVVKNDLQAVPEAQAKWSRLKSGQSISTRSGGTVGPLLTTTWDQGQFYNALCPEDANGPNGHVWTGCVATAMAQIINYWGYPAHGRGTQTYETLYGTLSVNYDSANYNYTLMPNALTVSSTVDEINAVATLLRDCGVAANMGYSPYESGSYDVNARTALINYFRFSPDLSYATKSNFSNYAWHSLLRENLDASCPILYSGQGSDGHSFICDGYNTDNYFHFNFGWSGFADGWYLITDINPIGHDYNSNQTALVGIVPSSTSNIILGQMGGTSTFSVEEPLEFYHLLGHNAYTGEDYSNGCYSTVVFTSTDPTKQLVLDVLSFENQNITVYDSVSGSQLAALSANTSNNPVSSSTSALVLQYQGSMNYTGFHLNIRQDNGCHMVSNITWFVDTTTIHLFWHENGDATQWQIEYGLKGFGHGEGTMITTNDTTLDITELESLKEYDVYIRTVCGGNQYGMWRSAGPIRTDGLYWKDVVLSQPEGYVEDSLGNAYISSAEGLVWFSKLSQLSIDHYHFFSGRKAFLTNDIDLMGYKWTPIHSFYGTFDGQGHKIDNLYCIENNRNGLFYWLTNGTIKNVLLTNCYSKDGLVVRSFGNDTIMNCFVSGTLIGGDVGTIVTESWDTTYILNCASNCVITATGDVGGIAAKGSVGYGSGHPIYIRNCYSASEINSNAYNASYILGYGEYATVENCYGYYSRNGNMHIARGNMSTFRDNTWFDKTDSDYHLIQPIFFEPDSQYYSILTEALNAGVRKYNLPGLRLWVNDTAGVNEGMPLLGSEYNVICPNIQNLTAKNIMGDDGEIMVELSWIESGEATSWEIKYHLQNSTDDVITYITVNNPDTIRGLSIQNTYLFSVRPVCSSTAQGGWSEEFGHVVDLPYWTDIVTSQPEGYVINSGNITISTAEGLAWLISVVNGLNGETKHTLFDKKVVLTQDIDLGQFRWTAINGFRGVFDGGGKTINNLYINELKNYQGLFGQISYGSYKNITLANGNVNGLDYTGLLFGSINNSKINNCHVNGTVYGENYVGGVAGTCSDCGWVNACSSTGTVYAKYDDAGGLFGHADYLRNCYSRCNVTGSRYSSGGLIGSNGNFTGLCSIENCYSTGNVDGSFYKGGLTGGSRRGPLRNCYFAGSVSNGGWVCMQMGSNGTVICGMRAGIITGSTNSNLTISNCYGLPDGGHPFFGIAEDYTNPIVSDTASIVVSDSDVLLWDSVVVGNKYYTVLLDALNAWVDTYDTAGLFLNWVADTANINGGFPIFEEQDLAYHTVTLTVADSTPWGSVNGGGLYENKEKVAIISATPDEGFHFVQWNDGNTENPRVIAVTQDTAFSAIFEINTYSIVGSASALLNYSFNFENTEKDHQWTFLNGDNENRLVITMLDDTTRALFVSNDNGVTNAYTKQVSTDIYAYTTTILNAGRYTFQYDIRKAGASQNDNMRIALIPASEQQTPTEWGNAITYGVGSDSPEWTHTQYLIDIPETGSYHVVVNWHNSATGSPVQTAAAIDNIQISSYTNPWEEEQTHGVVLGSDTVPHLDTVILAATPDEGYQFIKWNDGNADNPRIIVADADKYYTAIFECIPIFGSDSVIAYDWWDLNDSMYTTSTTIVDTMISHLGCDSIVTHYLTVYKLTKRSVTLHVADSTPHGSVNGDGDYFDYFTVIATISATPDFGYRFVQWNDGNTDNPRTVNLTQDTTFVAIFEKDMFSVIGTAEASINYDFDFEDSSNDSQWRLLNKDYYSQWNIDTLNDTNRALSIGCPWGNNIFYQWGTSCVYAYTTLHFFPGEYHYSYDWRCNGASTRFMRVVLVPDSVLLIDSLWSSSLSLPDGAIRLHNSYTLSSQFEWRNNSDVLLLSEGGDYKLIVQWYNEYYYISGSPASATIDNIHFYNLIPTGNTHGYVIGSDTVPYLDTVMLTAVPDEGYHFVKWHDENTDNPRHVVATSNRVVRAMFEEDCIPSVSIEEQTVCESFTWVDGITYYESTNDPMLTIPHGSANGCDSVVHLHLTVLHGTNHIDTVTTCENYYWHGQTYTESGDYSQTFTVANGCDSVVALHLIVNQSTNNSVQETACESFEWHGTTYIESGTYTYEYENAFGCSSVDTLYLVIQFSQFTYFSDTACNSYEWNDQTYTVSGDYSQIFTASNGCDSIVTLHLTIKQPSTGDTAVFTCGSFSWYEYTNLTQSGEYTYNITNAVGCDSAVTLHLTIYHEVDTIIYDQFCNGSSYFFFDQELVSSGTYTQVGQTIHGCDSTVTLHLEMKQTYSSFMNVHLCDGEGYGFFGETLYDAGTYMHTMQTEFGCDSNIVLTVTTGTTTFGVQNASICEGSSYNFYGQQLSDAGDYTMRLTNSHGCDSVVTLLLSLNHADSLDFSDAACDSYTWNGETYTASGDYSQTFTNAAGCDSVLTLHLTIQNTDHTDFTDEAYDSYTWNGETYTVSGDYTQTFTNVHGCDSIVTLHLTITVGIDDHHLAASMTVYPNPTTGMVNVECTMNNVQAEKVEFLLFDAFGRLLRTTDGVGANNDSPLRTDGHGSSAQTQIDLSHYAAGVYFIKAVADEKVVAVRKVMKR